MLRPILEMTTSNVRNHVELVTVPPAVPGRLLRFHGDFLHAVPRPTDLWLLKFMMGAQEYEPEKVWGAKCHFVQYVEW